MHGRTRVLRPGEAPLAVGGRCRPVQAGLVGSGGAGRRHDPGPVGARRREHAVVPGQVGARLGHQCGKSAEEAKALDWKTVPALIVRPGFSTHGDSDRDAGRGVGLDLVRRMVLSLGGRISVATSPGKYTRFRVLFPAEQVRRDAVA